MRGSFPARSIAGFAWVSELPCASGGEAIAAFKKAGFVLDRTSGSHHTLKKSGHRFVLTVPVHGNKPLKKGTLRALIRASGLSVEEFAALL